MQEAPFMSVNPSPFDKLIQVIAKLRDPQDGCPWDLKQTHETLRPYVVEETYELLDAISAGDDGELCKELGDLLLQVVLHAQVAKDRGAFSIDQVVEAITTKMISRHPHVFGETKVADSEEVLKNWETLKKAERTKAGSGSLLSGVPQGMPALLRAQRMGEKTATVGFDWDSTLAVLEKLEEEVGELKEALQLIASGASDQGQIAHEMGDILFSVAQLSRWYKLSAEDCLHQACQRFSARFGLVEARLGERLSEASMGELEQAWQEAKATIANSNPKK